MCSHSEIIAIYRFLILCGTKRYHPYTLSVTLRNCLLKYFSSESSRQVCMQTGIKFRKNLCSEKVMILLYRPVYRPYLESILFSNRSLDLIHTHTHNLYVALSPATRVAILSVLKINLCFQKETDVTCCFITKSLVALFFFI